MPLQRERALEIDGMPVWRGMPFYPFPDAHARVWLPSGLLAVVLDDGDERLSLYLEVEAQDDRGVALERRSAAESLLGLHVREGREPAAVIVGAGKVGWFHSAILVPGAVLEAPNVELAADVIMRYGNTQEHHHARWVIDQALRHLLGEFRYREFIDERTATGFDWDEGIAP